MTSPPRPVRQKASHRWNEQRPARGQARVAAGVALLLGLVGVYGVISYAVSQRSRELGLRMAMGAQAGQMKRMVVRQGLVLSAVGVAIGLALALGLTRLMVGLLFGVSPVDPLTFPAVAAAFIGVALVASYLPARGRAAIPQRERGLLPETLSSGGS